MKLNDFFTHQPHGSKAAMAKALGISKTWLSLIITEKEMPSPTLAVAISNYTKNKVKRQVLRPDIFGV
jgi:DNA-binding transcriptional regulator YdaS (Cro superfamily)